MHFHPILIASVAYNTFSVDAQTGTGKFFVNWYANKCEKDCAVGGLLDANNQCAGIVTEAWIYLHDTIATCCSTHLSWIEASCISGSGSATTTNTPSFTDKFFVEWATETCVKDCDPANGAPCRGNPPPDTGNPPVFFATADACCINKLWWKTTAACAGTTNLANTNLGNTNSGGTQTCAIDADCTKVCSLGTCSAPTINTNTLCPCTNLKTVPNQCDVDILIDQMEFFVSSNHELIARWLRAAFHDAGTFNQLANGGVGEGGANGCLINEPLMRNEAENFNLDSALNTLEVIKADWNSHTKTCIDVSTADILQFAGFFVATRQTGVPGPLDQAKRDILVNDFEWGRPDEPNCDLNWVDNLPGFSEGAGPLGPARCIASGIEIKEKMMDGNSFTAEEATALIGAHTIGLVRDTFGTGLAGPWVLNGADDFTLHGPIFDNAYFDFGINTIQENTCQDFANNISPFTTPFPTWFRQNNIPSPGLGLDWLDTDISLVMPPAVIGAHPDFHTFSSAFAADNYMFIDRFFKALDKMGKLGVDPAILSSAGAACGCGDRRRLTRVERSLAGVSGELTPEDMFNLAKKLGDAIAKSTMSTIAKQNARMDEVKEHTTPLLLSPQSPPVTGSPTSSPAPTPDPLTPTRRVLRG